ncbi:thioredoxin H-type-like [Chenopodium quinoa]|uniref:Thioredoxin domain-containing protein n=1 Tax=Chenopodium quinoa TaxID=63459 RepID=A0A803MI43_CHEQI|nr:thioredoxin H-type-like [Chenopodium quinoa]
MGLCASRDDDEDSSAHYIMADGNVHLITTIAAWEEKLMLANQQDKIIIANFSAAWCGPCKMIASYYCELSRKYTSLMFLTIDVDELPDLSTSFDIKATPSFFFLQNGQEIDKLVGSNKAELLKKITAVVDAQGRPF